MPAELRENSKTINILAAGQTSPDWDYLHARLPRLGIALNEAQWVSDLKSALPFLRAEPWDCLLIGIEDSYNAAELHALQVYLGVIREMGFGGPVILLSEELSDSLVEISNQWNCQFHEVDFRKRSSAMDWMIVREIQANQTREELKRARSELQVRQQREREEASLILSQQHRLLHEIVSTSSITSNETVNFLASSRIFDDSSKQKYDQVLKNVVISGTSGSRQILPTLLTEFEANGLTPGDILSLHLQSLEKLISGTGEKSTRHILQRADQLLVEVMVSLAETYRQHAA